MEENKKNIKIILVDDDTFLLEMYARKFQNSGFEVSAVSGAEEALMNIKNGETADILLFDIIMPKMDGLEFITEIRKQNLLPKAVKIVLSNQGQQIDIDKAKEIGIDDYIIKAFFTPSEVVGQVLDIFNNKKK